MRGEYFLVDRDGLYTDPADPLLDQAWTGTSRGVYIEGVYRINRTWETGYRYDRLWAERQRPLCQRLRPGPPQRDADLAQQRIQPASPAVSHDQPNPTDTDNALTLQYQVSLGAHGAHKF